MDKLDEIVLAFPRNALLGDPLLSLQGYLDCGYAPELLHIEPHLIADTRRNLEENPAFKQVIPYVVCMTYDGLILTYERLKGGGEKRLHGNYSIGIGGHANPIEHTEDVLMVNAKRELLEEIGIYVDHLSVVGYINDDSNDVGKVHFGVVYNCYVQPEEVNVIECDTLRVEWKTLEELKHLPLENWSRMIVDCLTKSKSH